MKFEVNPDICIGCGACQAICPEVFQINSDGYAEAIEDEVKKENEENAVEAQEGCPVGAIETISD